APFVKVGQGLNRKKREAPLVELGSRICHRLSTLGRRIAVMSQHCRRVPPVRTWSITAGVATPLGASQCGAWRCALAGVHLQNRRQAQSARAESVATGTKRTLRHEADRARRAGAAGRCGRKAKELIHANLNGEITLREADPRTRGLADYSDTAPCFEIQGMSHCI